MTIKAKSDIEAIRDAIESMAPDERAQFISFVEGMAYKSTLAKSSESEQTDKPA